MPFPFLWIGALVAAAFLALTFALFGLLMKLMNRATTEVRASILPGLAIGIRDWADHRDRSVTRTISPRPVEDAPMNEEVSGAAGLRLQPVRRTR